MNLTLLFCLKIGLHTIDPINKNQRPDLHFESHKNVFLSFKYLNISISKEITKKDPFLEKRLFFLTFFYLCSDTISLSFFALPLSFMISFATTVTGFGFFSLWLIASWQTDTGSVLFANLLVVKNQITESSPKKTWEGISGGIFLRFFFFFYRKMKY